MQVLAQRVFIPRILSTVFFHGQASVESSHSPASTLWFIKVICTVCINSSHSLDIFDSGYFRENLNPFVAFSVIQHLSNKLKSPSLAFSLFRYLRLNLNIIHLESTFDLLLRSLCGMGMHESAKIVYEYMKKDGFFPRDSSLNFVVLSFANAGMFRISEEILISEAETCYQKGEVVSSVVYNNFLSLLLHRNLVDEAIVFFRCHVLRLRSFCPNTCSFNIVMQGLCRIRKVEKAFEFFYVMRNFGCIPDIVTYNTLISGFCRVGSMDRAQELLSEIQSHHLITPDVVTYTSVISGFCKSGSTDEAAKVFDEMINFGIRPNLFTFNIIIDGFGKKGDVNSAMKMVERMVSGGFHPDVVTFTSIIDGHCRLGDLDKGMKLWNEMGKKNVAPNAYTFSVLINALCKANRLNESRDLIRQMNLRKDIVPLPFIYNPVIDGFCKAGNVDEANRLITELEAKGCVHDKMTFTILIIGHCMKGRMFEAIAIYKNMLSMGCAPDNITLSSLVSCLRKAGMACEANEIELNAANSVHSALSSSQRGAQFMNNIKIPVAI